MDKSTILILGATSPIARHTSILLAKKGYNLILAGRDEIELETIANDLRIRTHEKSSIHCEKFDIENLESHQILLDNVHRQFPSINGVICAVGTMDLPLDKIIKINYSGCVFILENLAHYFEKKQSGFISVITSVAGDRGRQSNYLYGSAKGGLNIYLQGLQNRLYKSHVRVINFKLGFVDTALTFGLPKLFCVASPQKIAEKIVQKITQKVNFTDTLYLPRFWFLIMLIIKNIPEIMFKRLSL
jgi:decaprenylphospho-beta-D-erythro-pentofuranosid-2-ulose 2-reductase